MLTSSWSCCTAPSTSSALCRVTSALLTIAAATSDSADADHPRVVSDDASPQIIANVPSSAPTWQRGRRPPCTQLSGGLLHPTRLVRALVPIATAHSSRNRQRVANLQRIAAPPAHPRGRLSSEEHESIPRSPTDLLDDMPVYTPSDANGPPKTLLSSYTPMRSLPAPLSMSFFYRNVDGRSSAVIAEEDREGGARDDGRRDSRQSRGGRNGEELFYCRLCREEIGATQTPRQHIYTNGVGTHVNHVVREVALDTVTLLSTRGYPIDDVLTVWAETLFHCPDFLRVRGLSNAQWSIEKRARHLGDVMHALRRSGVIDVSLERQVLESSPNSGLASRYYRRRRAGFERLEYIGDSFWSVHITKRLVQLYPDQQWMYGERSHSLNAIRDACEMNTNLDFVFDTLNIAELMVVSSTEGFGAKKIKADLVEAILGELHTYVIAFEPKLDDNVEYVEVNGAREAQLCALVQHCLSELYDLVVLQHARQLLHSALPLAKELAAKRIWQPTRPLLHTARRIFRQGDGSGGGGGGRSSSSSSRSNHGGGAVSVRSSSPATRNIWPFYGGDMASTSPSTAAASPYEELFDLSPSRAQLRHSKDEANVIGAGRCAQSSGHDEDGQDAAAHPPNEDCARANAPPPTGEATDTSNESPFGLAVDVASLNLATPLHFGTTRMLPGLPRLHGAPRAYPTTTPHPLRHLPLSAIPRSTYCEHAHADVFERIIASYHRLHLLHDDARQTRYVVSRRPAQWDSLIATLAPQLAHMVMASATGASGVVSTAEHPLVSGGEDTVVDGGEKGGGEAVHTRASGLQSDEATRRLAMSMDEGDLYCRDTRYDLAAVPASPHGPPCPAPTVDAALRTCGLPALASTPTQNDGGVGGDSGSAFSSFASSRFVPRHTRPPPAGVVTDRNLCHGTFAFLAVGETDPVGVASKALEAVQALSMRVAGPEGPRREQTSPSQTDASEENAKDSAAREVDEGETWAKRTEAAYVYWKRQSLKPPLSVDIFERDSGAPTLRSQ